MISLRRQLCACLMLTMIVLLTTSTAINLRNARAHLLTHVGEHAQETASLLAYSLSTSANTASPEAVSALLTIAFEQGPYDAVIYRDAQGNTLFERHKPVRTLPIPTWFMHSFSLTAPIALATVTAGNAPQGSIQITANLNSSYLELWHAFSKQLILFAVASVLLGLLCHLALQFFLRPLRRVQEQAAAICERKFIEQQPLPKTKELRDVVDAMNRMSRRLKTIFHEQLAHTESLRAQSFLDLVTGLANRRSFNARMQALAETEMDSSGCLMILQINDFARYNLQHGHDAGDECLRAIATQLQTIAKHIPNAILSRRAGADFAFYLPNVDTETAKDIADRLIVSTVNLSLLFQHQVHIGIVCCNSLHAEQQLLAKADMALRQAQSQSRSGWNLYQHSESTQIVHEAQQWFATLNRVLQDRNLFFHFQPMFLSQNRELLAVESFCRINVREGMIHAGVFMPMAERFDMAEAFDRVIIDAIRNSSEAANCKVPVCINLSPRSVVTRSFVDWLDNYLREHPVFAKQMIIETAEYLVCSGDEHVRHLCEILHRHGAKLSLDHFGIHSGAFGYLNSLPLDFIKIDRCFIRNIHLDQDNQFYVRSLIQIAHSCDITILAEGVESTQEWECLCQLGINGGQGYLLGKPDSHIKQAKL